MSYVHNSQLEAFTIYHQLRESDTSSSRPAGPVLPALGHALAGSAGTAISTFLVYPLDLIITRLQVQRQLRNEVNAATDAAGDTPTTDEDNYVHYDGVADAVAKIYAYEGGVRAFYSGVLHDTAKSVADSFLFFLAYTVLRQTRLRSSGSGSAGLGKKTTRLPVVDELAVGMLAGAFGKFFTTPIQNVVTRKQTAAFMSRGVRASKGDISKTPRTAEIIEQIRQEKGVTGFWAGYSASLVLTLNPALTFLLHETLSRALLPRSRRADPGPTATFLLAAVSKAVASTITYPFSMAKARAQVSSMSEPSSSKPASEKQESKVTLSTSRERRRRTTVFSIILRIARREGVGALYDGLSGEVLKGFFAHGITMLMKERIHSAIIQLYFLLLRLLKQYPSPEVSMQDAKTRAREAAQVAMDRAGDAVQVGKDGLQKSSEGVAEGTRWAKENVSDVSDTARRRIDGTVGDIYGKAKEAKIVRDGD